MPTEEETYRKSVQEKLDQIHRQVLFTNGKVRKIIVALVLLAGIVIGQGLSPHEIVTLMSGMIAP